MTREQKSPAHPLAGLRGKALELAQAGIPLREQIERARIDRIASEEEASMSNTATKTTTRTRTRKAASKPKRREVPGNCVTVADVAKAAGVEPLAIRKYCRTEGIDKNSETGRYHWSSLKNPTVKRIVKGVKAAA